MYRGVGLCGSSTTSHRGGEISQILGEMTSERPHRCDRLGRHAAWPRSPTIARGGGLMSEPVVFISHFAVKEGALGELERMSAGATVR